MPAPQIVTLFIIIILIILNGVLIASNQSQHAKLRRAFDRERWWSTRVNELLETLGTTTDNLNKSTETIKQLLDEKANAWGIKR